MVKQKVVIDTNIIIDHLRQKWQKGFKSQLESILESKSIVPLLSSATIQELFAGRSSTIKKEELIIRKVLILFQTISINEEVAEFAGKIMRDTESIVQFAGAQIAATALLENAFLLTKNKKDFANIRGIKFYQ